MPPVVHLVVRELGPKRAGWEPKIRTWIAGFRDQSPAVGRVPNFLLVGRQGIEPC